MLSISDPIDQGKGNSSPDGVTSQNRPQLQNASALWALGISVIPLHHPGCKRRVEKSVGKVPLLSEWKTYQGRVCTEAELCAWFDVVEPRNVGLVMGRVSGLIAIDIDSEDARQVASGLLPPTPMRTRTAKGEHWFYRYPQFASEHGYVFKNSVRVEVGGQKVAIDVRADGAYVVGPGSLHESGVEYEAVGGVEQWSRILHLVPPIEAEILAKWSEPKTASRQVRRPLSFVSPSLVMDAKDQARRYLSVIPGAVEGCGGDQHTFTTACKIARGFGLSESDTYDLMSEWNQKCSPPWSDVELRDKIEGAFKYGGEPLGGRLRIAYSRESTARSVQPDSGDASLPPAAARGSEVCPLTDSGNSEFFARTFGDRVRFDYRRGKWLVWDTDTWRIDADEAVARYVKESMRLRQVEVAALDDVALATAFLQPLTRKEALSRARSFEDAARLTACVTLARKEYPIADRGDGWDADPWVVGCPNGVIDLRTGQLRRGRPDDRITMRVGVPFDAQATAPRWVQFVAEIFGGDVSMASWLQRAVGYSLTGDRGEQCFFVCYGVGANGKSTLLDLLRVVFGDYARNTPFSTLENDQRAGISNDVAALAGRRLVTAGEVQDGVRLNEARIKAMTGDRSLEARFLYGEWFSFVPVMKLWVAVNHRPTVRDDSAGFWRRMHLIPFEQTFARNPQLAAELESEAPGILAWAVRGCLAWQAARAANGSTGLEQPGKVAAATAEYRSDSDHLQGWIDNCCVVVEGVRGLASDLYKSYCEWAAGEGLSDRERMNATVWGRKMAGKAFRKKQDGPRGKTQYHGIAVRGGE